MRGSVYDGMEHAPQISTAQRLSRANLGEKSDTIFGITNLLLTSFPCFIMFSYDIEMDLSSDFGRNIFVFEQCLIEFTFWSRFSAFRGQHFGILVVEVFTIVGFTIGFLVY